MLAFLVHYLIEIVKFCMIITFDHTSTVTFDYSGVRRKLENCGLMTSYSNFCNGYRYGHCYKHKALSSTSTYAMEKTYDFFFTPMKTFQLAFPWMLFKEKVKCLIFSVIFYSGKCLYVTC